MESERKISTFVILPLDNSFVAVIAESIESFLFLAESGENYSSDSKTDSCIDFFKASNIGMVGVNSEHFKMTVSTKATDRYYITSIPIELIECSVSNILPVPELVSKFSEVVNLCGYMFYEKVLIPVLSPLFPQGEVATSNV